MSQRSARPEGKALRAGQMVAVGGVVGAAVVGVGYTAWMMRNWVVSMDRAAEDAAQYENESLAAATQPVDPALVKWKQVGSIPTDMKSLKGIATLGDGKIAVVGERALRVLDGDGKTLVDVPLGAVPQAVAGDAQGRLYVAMKDHVEVFAADGKPIATWATVGLGAFLTGVTPDQDGGAWVADAGQRVVMHLSGEGKILATFGRADEEKHVRGIVTPSPHLDVALAADGSVIVNNPGRHSIEAYNAAGEVTNYWGEHGMAIAAFTGCCNPTDIALLPGGLIATAEKGVPRVKVYDAKGKLESVVAGPESFGKEAAGLDLAVDGMGRLLVMDPVEHAIKIFARDQARGSEGGQ